MALRATTPVSKPAARRAPTSEIFMPGRYSMVSTQVLLQPQWMTGEHTQGTPLKLRRNLHKANSLKPALQHCLYVTASPTPSRQAKYEVGTASSTALHAGWFQQQPQRLRSRQDSTAAVQE